MNKIKNNYFILTGAMGAGKSAVLNKLQKLKYNCIPEPARLVLKEQRSIKGDGVPEINPELFNRLMLSKMLNEYEKNIDSEGIFIFDRGFPDLIAYSVLFNIDKDAFMNAAMEYRYNQYVFMFNPWEEIYNTDAERKMSFSLAKDFGENVKKIYQNLGYITIDVPFSAVEERVLFISENIERILKK